MASRSAGSITIASKARMRLLAISPQEATFRRRGFDPGAPAKQQRFEHIGETFVAGYNAAIQFGCTCDLTATLEATDAEFRGFAYEGAAMGLSVLDAVTFGNGFAEFLAGPGDAHAYMIHVGAGWAVARLPWRRLTIDRTLERYDKLLRWLAIDGYGFHQGYFHWRDAGQKHSAMLPGYARRAYDQGLGRCVWFACCAEPDRVARTVGSFDAARRADLWSGIGLAAAYAGGHSGDDLGVLLAASREHVACLAQGAAFAAKARIRAGNLVAHTQAACDAFCGMSAAEAALVTDKALKDLPPGGYEMWRQRIQSEFAAVRR